METTSSRAGAGGPRCAAAPATTSCSRTCPTRSSKARPGFDTINVSTFTASLYDPDHPCPENPSQGWEIDLLAGIATQPNGETVEFQGIEGAIGSDSNDRMTGDTGDNYLRGLCGNDILEGRAGEDTLIGDDGMDACIQGEVEEACEQ